jgi:hypothetical protein
MIVVAKALKRRMDNLSERQKVLIAQGRAQFQSQVYPNDPLSCLRFISIRRVLNVLETDESCRAEKRKRVYVGYGTVFIFKQGDVLDLLEVLQRRFYFAKDFYHGEIQISMLCVTKWALVFNIGGFLLRLLPARSSLLRFDSLKHSVGHIVGKTPGNGYGKERNGEKTAGQKKKRPYYSKSHLRLIDG